MRTDGSKIRTTICVVLFVILFLSLPLSQFSTGSMPAFGATASGASLILAQTAGEKATPKDTTKDSAETSVTVRCRGRLRHGMVAIGGETTGTTITFHRTIWELNLPDEDTRQLADRMNKEVVVITGSLRRVIATENVVRWIVDVEKLSPPGPEDAEEDGAEITVKGTLRAALAMKGEVPDMSVRTEDQIWHLDFGTERRILTSAEPLIGKYVLLSGKVLPPPDDVKTQSEKPDATRRHIIRVRKLESLTE
jgi:hypothetical protein